MGLFFKSKEKCCICGNEEGKKKISSGFICKQCLHLCSINFQVKINKNTTKEAILIEIEKNKNNKKLVADFTTTKKIGPYIEFDEQKGLWLIPDGFGGKKVNPRIHAFGDIVEYELLQDGDSITKGGLGRAVAGGVLLGGVGAVVGGVTGKKKTKSVINNLRIKITVNDTSNPSVYIDLIKTPTKANSFIYKTAYSSAQEILSMLSIITQKTSDENTNTKTSVADELIKLKGLLDEGILTQEEFTSEKNKLLNK
ncbi:SHOCT domain-containing protein [Clostridium sporogenes]|uniref:SHOCT domain-containing protein n=1 Tax=Clostridium botulinum TaxID=1491 RepID=A0A6M0SV95_CLOBO|nr:SHOCT domain-containing protein [Clostridium sporogenes]NFA59457.1 SHOCT domain-containing protein [Clostridium botulinum]NFI74641.1 SHOCT domain-containing protein [Clostridium sporogenes]NFL71224.1 SHOCT domain-containing protein [Clostridium sporogenes]NFM25387.1 SHOCT domain-containing protein [Clostridium sporogenes]NFP62497.1 SHOCT domain-containing protein [Clostridium sporogenes]